MKKDKTICIAGGCKNKKVNAKFCESCRIKKNAVEAAVKAQRVREGKCATKGCPTKPLGNVKCPFHLKLDSWGKLQLNNPLKLWNLVGTEDKLYIINSIDKTKMSLGKEDSPLDQITLHHWHEDGEWGRVGGVVRGIENLGIYGLGDDFFNGKKESIEYYSFIEEKKKILGRALEFRESGGENIYSGVNFLEVKFRDVDGKEIVDGNGDEYREAVAECKRRTNGACPILLVQYDDKHFKPHMDHVPKTQKIRGVVSCKANNLIMVIDQLFERGKTENEVLSWFENIINFMGAGIREEFKELIVNGKLKKKKKKKCEEREEPQNKKIKISN